VNDELSQDPSLVHDFIVESEELLERMDQDMVALESAPQDADLLNRIFRAMHTIKGTSGFLGFDPIVRLSHRAEDVLNAVRRGEAKLDRRAMDALLASRDQLGRMLQDLQQGSRKEYSLDALLAELDEVQKPPSSPPTLGELLVKDNVITPATLESVLAEQAASTEPRKLGQMLVEKGLSTPTQVGDALARQKKLAESEASSQTMRVDAHKLDDLINLIGELVLERNRLVQLSHDTSSGKQPAEGLDVALAQTSSRLSFITDELQSAGLKTRMIPIESLFRRIPRMVRDISRDLQKDVQLILRGQDTELDKTMVELIGDPLVHLVRNALDHGIEMPDVRTQAGKPRQGTIRLEACQQGDRVVISMSDDGGGINPERIGRKAVEKGLVTPERLRQLNPREVLDFIFLPGFSTAEKLSDLSGRGVGLDVVRTNLKKLNGSLEIESQPGAGTTIQMRLPLTLIILPVLLVQVAEEVYALPLHSVLETAPVNVSQIHHVEGREVLNLGNQTLPLVRLQRLLRIEPGTQIPSSSSAGREIARKLVILGVSGKRLAVMVDRLLGQESTVVKPLGNYLSRSSSLAGATISGDGRVRLVLDPAGLLATSQLIPPTIQRASA
jgi:two-component system, chemotaxis family, sensor kinase CheA